MLLVFFLAWIIFNGKITVEILALGAAVSVAVFAFVCKFMDYSLKKEWRFYKIVPFLCRYLVVLVKEIVLANISVWRMVLTRREKAEPVIVKVHTRLKTKTALVMLANSITLTPGTITLSLRGQDLMVHCLDRSLAEGMEDSVFVKMLEKLEEEAQ